MKDDTEAGIKSAAGAGLGALLGGFAGSKFPGLAGKILGKNIPERAQSLASAGIGSVLGSAGGKAVMSNDIQSEIGGDLGLMVGAPIGALASVPFIKSNPKGKLLKYLLGTGVGGTAGVGVGTYLGAGLLDSANKVGKAIDNYDPKLRDGKENLKLAKKFYREHIESKRGRQ
jgi:hypothetical protein